MPIADDEIVFGIVLYNEELEDSVTFKSLVHNITSYTGRFLNKISVFIFDNTPRNSTPRNNNIFDYNEFIKIYYYTENTNKGLPFSYNLFNAQALYLGKKWLVLLDQDTELPQDFLSKYLLIDPSIKIHCPLVFNNGSLMSPSYYRSFRTSPMEVPDSESLILKDKTCINSGLMINVEFFEKIGGYNPKLFLDFCDHDFIHKVKQSKLNKIGIIPCVLQQDFSATSHTKEQAMSRYNFFVRDLKEFYKGKNKFKILFLVDLPRIFRLIMKFKTIEPLKTRYKK